MNRVDCINKADRHNPWERILRLGGVRDDNGMRWSCTQQECVAHIHNGIKFYVLNRVNNQRVYLIVARSAAGNEYVKTMADYYEQDNLLALPECA
jgi:hypothetical protein